MNTGRYATAMYFLMAVSLTLAACRETETVCIDDDAVTFLITSETTTELDRRSCPSENPPQVCDDGSCVCAVDDTACTRIINEREAAARREAEERRRASCCRVCETGKACGDACIPVQNQCRTVGGCACNG